MNEQAHRLMHRVHEAIGEHATENPEISTFDAAMAVYAVGWILGKHTSQGAEYCAAVHLRAVSESPLAVLAALGRAYEEDPKMTAAIGAAIMTYGS